MHLLLIVYIKIFLLIYRVFDEKYLSKQNDVCLAYTYGAVEVAWPRVLTVEVDCTNQIIR